VKKKENDKEDYFRVKYPEMMFDPTAVELLEAGKVDEMVKYAKEKWPEYDYGDYASKDSFEIKWLPKGTKFCLRSNCGYEWVQEHSKVKWMRPPANRVERDGKIAIILHDYRASSWQWSIYDDPEARFDPELIELIEKKDSKGFGEAMSNRYEDYCTTRYYSYNDDELTGIYISRIEDKTFQIGYESDSDHYIYEDDLDWEIA
jgi:hypothetical protein